MVVATTKETDAKERLLEAVREELLPFTTEMEELIEEARTKLARRDEAEEALSSTDARIAKLEAAKLPLREDIVDAVLANRGQGEIRERYKEIEATLSKLAEERATRLEEFRVAEQADLEVWQPVVRRAAEIELEGRRSLSELASVLKEAEEELHTGVQVAVHEFHACQNTDAPGRRLTAEAERTLAEEIASRNG